VILRLEFGLVDDRLFWFYMVFIGGIVANRLKENIFGISFKRMSLFLITFIAFSFLFFWKEGQYSLFLIPAINFVARETIVLDIAIIAGCCFLLSLLSRNRTSSVLTRYKAIIAFVSVSSFCVYLFHIEFFTLGIVLIGAIRLPAIFAQVLFYVLVVPLTFVFSYFVQINEKRFLNRLELIFKRRHAVSSPI
jgi:hypothetical protein